MYSAANRKVPKEYYREWRRRHKTPERLADNSARVRSYYEKHPEKKKEAWRRFTAKHGTKRRKSARIAYAVAAVMKRGSYTPRISRRKPEYAPVGASGIDTRSPFLWNNLTDEQRAYARELAIERKAQREAR